MRPPPKPGFWLVARREWRWILHHRVALILIFGVPLITLIDLNDLWVHFDLREDLVKALKVGDRFAVRIPALADRRITVEVRLIATKGEYASWRATRATGDFDLRTFSIRAYPVDKVPELRPGMSAYMEWATHR